VFGAAGVIVSHGGRALIQFVPWASGLIGVALILIGVALLAGRALPLPLALPHIKPRGRGLLSAFLFGIAYALASLSCTLPIFLAIVGGTLVLQGVGVGFALFVSYALGMGAVLIALTMSAALFKGVLARYLRAGLPYVERASAVLLMGAGGYLVFYQLYRYGGYVSSPCFSSPPAASRTKFEGRPRDASSSRCWLMEGKSNGWLNVGTFSGI